MGLIKCICWIGWLSLLASTGRAAGPVALFNGKTLEGWEGSGVWRVEDGVIAGGSMEGNPQNDFLATKANYRNFRLTLEYRLAGTEGFVNGGVQFRSERIADPPNEMIGYQADIGAGFSGSLYDESRRKVMLATADADLVRKTEKPGEWNRYEIRAEDHRIQLFVNGQRTVNYTETMGGLPMTGKIALQIHGGCKAVIQFRNIMIEVLPEDLEPGPEEIGNRFGDSPDTVPGPAFAEGKFSVLPGEIIVLTGQANMVEARKSGDLEARLAKALPGQAPRFRDMSWEGDTVYEQWRDLNFGDWQDQLRAVGAGMIFAQFGQVESFDGQGRLAEFTAAYHRLLDQFAARTPRLVLISPIPFEQTEGPHLPDLSLKNPDVAAYTEAVREIARLRNAIFVDLFTPLSSRPAGSPPLTSNGQHLNALGLRTVADLTASALGLSWSGADDLSALKKVIMEKNRLWADCWRPANWSFVYGDRMSQQFGKPGADAPSLRATFETYKPMVAALDARVAALARGESLPPLPAPAPPPRPPGQVPTPDQQLASFTVADGYEINLFASEAHGLIKPVQIAWDEHGKCYAACSPTYPQTLPGEKPDDFILVLEDTDQDGKADRSTRFVDGLTMVQGVEPGGGGVYVCDFDSLLHFKDTDGDGKADVRRVIFSGFGIGDTHQLINSISHGPDGSLWFTQGLHAFSRVETAHGLAVLERSGLWRYYPQTGRMEGFFNGAKAGHNCWGVAFDDYLQVFHKSGDRPAGYYSTPGLIPMPDPAEYHPVGALFDTNPKTTSIDFVGTKALPDDLQGCAIIGGYFGGVIERHRLEDDGSGFKSTQLPRLVTSTEAAFRPVDVSMGPDGAIYVSDWFNPAIGHYQTSYADASRDRHHGRIWRVSAKDYAPVRQPRLAEMSPEELTAQLRSPERWTRYQAKRLLFDGNPDAVTAAADKAMDSWISEKQVSPENAEVVDRNLMELCGVFESHQAPRPKLLQHLLSSADPRIRAYGARVTGAWAPALPEPLTILQKTIHDPHPRVRLETIVASARIPQPAAAFVAVEALDHPVDKFIDYALHQTIRFLQPHWQPVLGNFTPETALQAGFKTSSAGMAWLKSFAATPAPEAPPGKIIYDTLCLNCHQPEGHGLQGIYPPVSQSDWITGDPGKLVKILLHGLSGPIHVNGAPFVQTTPLPMPPMGLDDRQLTDLIAYLRSNFGNEAPPVETGTIQHIRAAHAGRTNPWTEKELGP